MIRRRVRVTSPQAYQALGALVAYREILAVLTELPSLYPMAPLDNGLAALTGHMTSVRMQTEDAYRDLVVAVSVHCGADHDVDVDSADNFRIAVVGGEIWALLATRERYEQPVLASLARPREPTYPVALDITTYGGL